MTADTIASSKTLLTNNDSECLYLGTPKHVRATAKGFSVKWAAPTPLPPQVRPFDRVVLFNRSGSLINSVRIVPTLIPDDTKEISLTLNP